MHSFETLHILVLLLHVCVYLMPILFDAIVIGGGPAGLSAGFYLGRAGRSVILFEKEVLGGQANVIEQIENLPGLPSVPGYVYVNNLINQALEFRVEVAFEQVATVHTKGDLFEVRTKSNTIKGKSVVLATGARFRVPDILNLQDFLGKGIYFCPKPKESPLFKNQVVAVLGGGDCAFDRALLLSRHARRVYLIYRFEPSALALLQRMVVATENIVPMMPYEIYSIQGNQLIRSVSMRNVSTKEEYVLEVDALFLLIGKEPNDELFLSHPGCFMCGDVANGKFRQVAIACGDGIKAGMECDAYLNITKKSYAYS